MRKEFWETKLKGLIKYMWTTLYHVTYHSWRTTQDVWEEVQSSLWWHPTGCWARQSCCMWPLTLYFLYLDPLVLLCLWKSLWWSRKDSRSGQNSMHHQGELWWVCLPALSWQNILDWQNPLTALQEDPESCRREQVRRGMRWQLDGVGCWRLDRALRAYLVPRQRRCRPQWVNWAAGRDQLT